MTVESIIIKYLKMGYTQPEIADVLKSEYVQPNSLSSVEKMLKSIRKKHGASTMFQLGYILAKQESTK